MWHDLVDDIRDWCRGRHWWARIPVLALIGWLMLRQCQGGFYATPLNAINLGIHEAGHLLLGFAGQFIGVAAGSGFQILAPLIAGALFVRQRDWFAVAFCLFWTGVSTGEVGTYASDAVAQAMPLVSIGGGDVIHDWAWLLDTLGLLSWTDTVAGCFYLVAVTCQIVGLVSGAWMTWQMWKNRDHVNPG